MKEFKFKVLEAGDELHSFSEKRMVIKKSSGDYHVYKITGFNDGAPKFDKSFKVVIEKGIGKIEAYDSETGITMMI